VERDFHAAASTPPWQGAAALEAAKVVFAQRQLAPQRLELHVQVVTRIAELLVQATLLL
jgi:hypothetical protein